MNSNKQLKLGAILSYIAILINIVSALLYSPWMLSVIGDGDYGLYTLATSLINMFLLDFGISSAVTRFVSKYVAEGNQEKANNFLGLIYKLFFAISFVVAIVLTVIYFFIDEIYLSLTYEELKKFKIVYIIAATFSVISFPFTTSINGIMTSYEKFIYMKSCDIINKLLTVFLIVIALLHGYGLYALVAINALCNLFALLLKMIALKKTTPVKVNFKYFDAKLIREVFGFSVWVLLNSICSRLIMNICPSILGMTSGTLAITVFSFASAIEGYTYTFASAIDGMFMPRIAKIAYKDKNMEELLPLMTKVGRFQYNLVCLILVGFACVGREFVTLWIGEEYAYVYYCALLLILPAPFYLSQQVGKNAMVMLNQVKYLTYVNIIKAGMNIVLVFILSRYYGVVGACLSICLVYFFRNIANMYLYQKKLGLNMKKFCVDCYGKMTIAMLFTFVISKVILAHITRTGWMLLILKSMIIVSLYLIFMWFIAFSKEEKGVILQRVRRLKKS